MNTKDRLTITLRKDLLKRIDHFVDGKRIRNRSHAIEYMVEKQLGSNIKTCVILAGGAAEQCGHPLRRVQNRPVIAYQIEQLREANIKELIIVINEKYGEVKEYLGDGRQWGVEIDYILDKENLGTAAALKLVEPSVRDTFLLFYGDVLADIDLLDLVESHRGRQEAVATLAIAPSREPQFFGICKTKGAQIIDYIEKPKSSDVFSLVNIGLAVVDPAIFKLIGEMRHLGEEVYPLLAREGKLFGYSFDANWFNVSGEGQYQRAKKKWR